jgi:hypothetical protein
MAQFFKRMTHYWTQKKQIGMSGKQMIQLAVITFKTYFNIDLDSCMNPVGFIQIAYFLLKLVLINSGQVLYDGLITVKEDAVTFKSALTSMVNRAGNRDFFEHRL